jgi:hypothetical protein
MKKHNLKIFVLGLLIIVVCLALAFLLQSAYMLFAASIIPFLIAPFFPDLRTNQMINPNSKSIQVYGVAGSNTAEPTYIVIEFKPGQIHWSQRLIYFSVDHIAVAKPGDYTNQAAALPVLRYDLVLRRGKKRWIGIYLRHLVERSSSFSFTINEVNRLVITMQDVKDLLSENTVNRSKSTSKSKQLQL